MCVEHNYKNSYLLIEEDEIHLKKYECHLKTGSYHTDGIHALVRIIHKSCLKIISNLNASVYQTSNSKH